MRLIFSSSKVKKREKKVFSFKTANDRHLLSGLRSERRPQLMNNYNLIKDNWLHGSITFILLMINN